MNSISQNKLQEIAQIMATASGANKIIIFGSRARGDFDALSDWDFLLVMPQTWNPSCFSEELNTVRAAHNALLNANFDFSIDIIPMRDVAFNTGNNVLARMIWSEGKTVLEVAEVAHA